MNSFSETPEYAIETLSRNFKMPSMHYHDAYELYFLEVGTRDYFVEDKFFSVSPGEIVLIKPGKLHRTGGEFCVRTLVHFTECFLAKTFTNQTIAQLLSCFEAVKIAPDASQLESVKLLLMQLHECESETDFSLTLGVLLQLLTKCGKEDIQFGQLGAIVAYINENFAAIQQIDQIAERFYISKFHLCRVFKRTMQVTIVDYLNQVKLRNARSLLEISDDGISEIAEQCGYHSVAYFSSIFKKSMGESPTEYRRRTHH